MPENTNHLDPDERLRSLYPSPVPPSEAEIDAALRRLLIVLPTAEGSPHGSWPRIASPRRVAVGGSVAITAAVAAFVAVNLLAGSPAPGAVSNAWAKRVIAHAAAAVAGPGSGILHVAETVTYSPFRDGSPTETYTTQSWQEQTPPYAYWQTTQQAAGGAVTVTSYDDTVEQYESASNTLTEQQGVPPVLEFGQFEGDWAYRAVFSLVDEQDLLAAVKSAGGSSSSQAPETLSDLIVALLNAPGVSVNPNASVDGEAATGINVNDGEAMLYVQPGTYTPLQFVIDTGSAGGPVTTTFTTYETLPTGSVSMPDLAQLYPNAQVSSTNLDQQLPKPQVATTHGFQP